MARKKKDPRKVPQTFGPEAYGIEVGRNVGRGKVAKESDLKLVGANITGTGLNTSTVVKPDGKPVTPEGGTLPTVTGPRSGAAYLTPEEQQQAREAQAVAGSIKAAQPEEKSWIANLFDTSDTFDENGNFKSDDLALVGGEAVLDGFMRGLQWGFDRLNQYTVAATSAIPGGTRTLTFDEANDVSFGQMLVANAGIASGRVRRGEANISDAIALSFGILPAIGAAIAGQVDPNTPVQQQGFDITSEKDREVFKNGAERFFSATGDFGFAFADPTLIAGWGTKIARLRYVDQLIDTPQKMQRATNEILEGQRVMKNQLDTQFGTDEVASGLRSIERDLPDVSDLDIAPRAMFLHSVVKQNADGSKATSWQEIYNHKVIRYSSNRDALTSALYNARTYDEAALVMRHAYGDSTALPELFAIRSDILAELIDGERELVRMTVASDPQKKAKYISEYQARIDEYDRDLEFLRTNAADDPRFMERLDFLTEKRNRAMEDMLNIANDNQVKTYSPAEIELTRRNIERLRIENPQARRVLAAASTAEGSMYGGVKGFSANNKFGRLVEKTRQKRATSQYETETTRGVRLWQETEFAYLNTPKGKAKRVLRVWRYLGAEAPAGIVRIAGASAQESAREVRALLNSIRIYGGKGKQMPGPDGVPVTIGGSLRKEQLLTEFTNAIAEGGLRGQDAAADAIRKIEDLIQQDLEKFYGVNNTLLSDIMGVVRTERSKLKEDILKNGFWVDPVTKKENKAPYLESQLEGSEIMANWRAIEKAIINDSKSAGHFRQFGAKFVGDAYSNFQDLWRPAVLLRLGYTQRNVAEGLFRSTAFQFSLAPLGLAAKQAGYSTGNTIRAAKYGRQGVRGVVEKAAVRAREGATIDQMPKRFQKWYKAQVDAVDAEISHHTELMDLVVRELAEENRTWRLAEQGRIKSRVASLAKEKERLRNNRPAGMTVDQADATIARIDMLTNDLDRRYAVMDGITGGADGPLPEYLTDAADNLLYFDNQIMPMLFAQREVLSNMRSAATMFREQTLAKRRIGQGQANVTDPKTLQATFRAYSERGAFDLEDSYTNIALANLSADHTSRQTLALRMSTAESILRNKINRTYVAVEPGQPQYFEGLATTLNQWKQSDVGEIIIRDMASGVKTDDQIAVAVATFLRTTPRGREIAAWVTSGNRTANPGEYAAFGQRVAAAHQSALKAALPEREAADKARDAIRQAEDDVAAARAALAEAQKTNPKRKALITPDGKRITDPDKYIQKRKDAYTQAEQKYSKKVETLSEKVKELPGFGPSLSVDDAMEYAVAMVQRYRQLTANSPDLQRVLLARGSITTSDKAPLAEFAKELENLIGPNARNANGDPYQLIPIIGNAAEDVGSKSFMDAIRAASNKAFRVLGTIPEDTFVRAPFYSRQFDETYQGLTRLYLAQKPDGATLSTRDVNAIRQAAHQRALKDTKDWLYTIDRRTLLGQYGEAIFPFISASQNSVSAVGRIIWNDPRVAALMIMIWNAPSRAGLEDEEGRMHFSLPLEWVPEDIRKAVGLDSMLDFTFGKDQFNLIAPPTGFGGALPIPVPGPAVVLPVSEMMKLGWFGLGPAAPDILVGVLGQETADQVWEVGKSYVFGSDEDITGMSAAPLSVDKILPAWGQKLYQFIQGEGSSSAYTAWYDKIYQSEYLKWAQGYRDEPPTPGEISDMTRNFYFLRMAMNLVAFTPPGFTSEITPIVEASRRIYENEPNSQLANMQIYEKFGGTIQQLLRIRSTEGVAGLDATADSYRLAKNHADLIGAVAPRLATNDTLNVIGVLAGNSRGDYDPSFSAAQQLAKIPNTDRYFREVINPAQAAIDSQISSGWAQYLRNMDVINAKLAERGLKSLQTTGAEDLMDLKKAMVERLRVDPRFEAWYGDYMGGVSSRTLDTVMTIQTALNDQRWRDAHKDDPIWGLNGAADQYMYARQQTIEALASTDDPDIKRGIREQWQGFRFDLGMRYPDWAAKQERYLSGDEDPDKPQIVLTSDVVPFQPPMSEIMDAGLMPDGMSSGSM